jgi:hypothetical protein
VREAQRKLEYLEQYGPTPQAFTFKQRFAAVDALASQPNRAIN